MDTNDSNIKPQQTGGLKIITVFFVVLALHCVAIGGITAYYLMKGGSADPDLTTTDKTHKDLKDADGTAIAPGAQTATPPTEVATIPQTASVPQAASGPANPATPAPDQTATTTPAPVLAPPPSLALTTPPATLTPPTEVADQGSLTPSGPQAASGPISSELAPPAEPAPAPSVAMASGPVHMPAVATPAPTSRQIYTVKITDSYKKIAHAHHITVAQLKEANHIKSDVLHAGQKLVIPSAGTLVADNAPASVTTLDASSSSPVLGESATPMTTGLASTTSTVATTGLHHHLYTVVKGDTLVKIAHKFKTTATALMAENSISDPTKLAIGKKLKIPSEESRSARNSAPASTQPAQVQTKENAPAGQLANFVP